MPVSEVTTVHYVCDLCGHETTNPLDHHQYADVKLSLSAMSYNGDIGGGSRTEWWCGNCVASFDEWRKTRKTHPDDSLRGNTDPGYGPVDREASRTDKEQRHDAAELGRPGASRGV